MLQISQIRLPCGTKHESLEGKIRKLLRLREKDTFSWHILRHSVDARKKPHLFDVYTVGVELPEGEKEERRLAKRAGDRNVIYKAEKHYTMPVPSPDARPLDTRPVIVGFGPAGIFSALLLSEAGYRPIVLERGEKMDDRIQSVEHFWKSGELNPESNIQFGEGGAGTFSDGKLTTNVKDAYGRKEKINEIFIAAGAPEDIAYENLPHIGTDILRKVVVNLRKKIEGLGGEIRFSSKASRFLFKNGRISGVLVKDPEKSYILNTECVILAPGHSSRDTIRELYRQKVPMSQKAFAIGFRVTHSQRLMNEQQYGISDEREMKKLHLPSVSYKVTAHPSSGRGVYSFCMCPGGYVVNASSEAEHLAVNGMSDYARDSGRANSAIVMTVNTSDFGSEEVLAGMKFQENLEKKAWEIADGRIPVERYTEFRERKTFPIRKLSNDEAEKMCLKGQASHAALNGLLPKDMEEDFIEGMENFEKKIPGFTGSDTLVCGLESRTSSPVRILRNDHFESEIPGLYPCGEGAGYAGGITSAAIDGMKVAEEIICRYRPLRFVYREYVGCTDLSKGPRRRMDLETGGKI